MMRPHMQTLGRPQGKSHTRSHIDKQWSDRFDLENHEGVNRNSITKEWLFNLVFLVQKSNDEKRLVSVIQNNLESFMSAKDPEGNTLLMLTIMSKQLNAFEILFERSCGKEEDRLETLKNKNGKTAKMMIDEIGDHAVRQSFYDIINKHSLASEVKEAVKAVAKNCCTMM